MDQNSDFKGSVAIALTLLAAVTSSYFLLNSPLVSLRPDQGSVIYDPTSESQFVRARLWQDPLLAAYDDWTERVKTNAADPAEDVLPFKIFQLPDNLIPQPGETTLRLLVMQSEETYVENIEQRRRQRYALISALTGENYVPEDESHIGYFLAPQFDPAKTYDPANPSIMLIAYETFRYFDEAITKKTRESGANKPATEAKTEKKIQVLWLNATDFDEYTLIRLSGLLTYMNHCVGAVCNSMENQVTNVILGPNSTGELTELYRAGIGAASGDAYQFDEQNADAVRYVRNLQIPPIPSYNPTTGRDVAAKAISDGAAIIGQEVGDHSVLSSNRDPVELEENKSGPDMTDAELLQAVAETRGNLIFIPSNVTGPLDVVLEDEDLVIERPESTDSIEREVARRLGIATFRSSILRDDIVLGRLFEELTDRGICRQERPSRIFIVSEQDTLYGRILDDLFRRIAEPDPAEAEPCRPAIVEIGYLRGIDGEMPLSDAKKTAEVAVKSEQKSQDNQGQTVAELFAPPGKERMAGPGQLDYISRLADNITREAQEVSGPITIGVLGSDVYDKLLILQSLKSRLPSALFFTTDLDSRLSGPEVYKWTRNLLIASSHSLEYDVFAEGPKADNSETAFYPVFRDAYQTSFFQATRMALDFAEGNETSPDLAPRLFEIGRTGPLEITPIREKTDSGPGPAESRRNAVNDPLQVDSGKVREDKRVLFNKAPISRRYLLSVPLLLFLGWALFERLSDKTFRQIPFLTGRAKVALTVHAFDHVIVLTAIALLIKLAFLKFVGIRGSEPIYLFEGISIYPVLSLQLSTIIMAVSMVIITRGRLIQARTMLADSFQRESCEKADDLVQTPRNDGRQGIHDLWFHHTMGAQIRKAAGRSLVKAVVTSIVVLILLNIASPGSLLTGEMQFSVYKSLSAETMIQVTRALSLFSVLLMYFICISVLAIACELMRQISLNSVHGWHDTSLPAGIGDNKQAMYFIVAITEIVTPIIYYPFFLMTMLLLARNTLFEGGAWHWLSILVFGSLVVYIFYKAASFQHQAVLARNRILEKLKREKIRWLREGAANPGAGVTNNSGPVMSEITDKNYDKLLDYTIDDIKGINTGAFVHWTSHPLLKAVALPSSSLGILTILLQ